jgi:hypothetical protein
MPPRFPAAAPRNPRPDHAICPGNR